MLQEELVLARVSEDTSGGRDDMTVQGGEATSGSFACDCSRNSKCERTCSCKVDRRKCGDTCGCKADMCTNRQAKVYFSLLFKK